jgi:hypothetical protein
VIEDILLDSEKTLISSFNLDPNYKIYSHNTHNFVVKSNRLTYDFNSEDTIFIKKGMVSKKRNELIEINKLNIISSQKNTMEIHFLPLEDHKLKDVKFFNSDASNIIRANLLDEFAEESYYELFSKSSFKRLIVPRFLLVLFMSMCIAFFIKSSRLFVYIISLGSFFFLMDTFYNGLIIMSLLDIFL